jgi:hypothetical protein
MVSEKAEMARGLFVFTDLGGDVSLVEEQPTVGDVLPRGFRPWFYIRRTLDGPAHLLCDALL